MKNKVRLNYASSLFSVLQTIHHSINCALTASVSTLRYAQHLLYALQSIQIVHEFAMSCVVRTFRTLYNSYQATPDIYSLYAISSQELAFPHARVEVPISYRRIKLYSGIFQPEQALEKFLRNASGIVHTGVILTMHANEGKNYQTALCCPCAPTHAGIYPKFFCFH